jgi:hypothetical protein
MRLVARCVDVDVRVGGAALSARRLAVVVVARWRHVVVVVLARAVCTYIN